MTDVLTEIRHTLMHMAETGCSGFDCSTGTLDTLADWGKPKKEIFETLADIKADMEDCRRCRLSQTRTQPVFGDGNSDARLVFVGEGPGYEEDKMGMPFVGAAGKLLTKIIQAMNLSREEVYICNIIKCRPPNNRNPLPEEISSCVPFLERQLRVIHPDYICALGKFAAQTLLQTDEPISKLRGRFHDFLGIKVMPTYHPAYLLRNPAGKRHVWDDMQVLMKAMGIE
jgi:DNA polymerase